MIRADPELLDRLPPSSLDAEKSVLGCMLLDSNTCDDIAPILKATDFYADANSRLFTQILAMREGGGRIDTLLLVEHLKASGELDLIGGAAYIAEIVQSVPSTRNVKSYATIIHEKATLRALITASVTTLQSAYDAQQKPSEVISKAEQRVFAINEDRIEGQVSNISDLLLRTFDRIDARMSGAEAGIKTGFTDLDTMTGGLHNSELFILASRPSMGKTAFATNIAEYASIHEGVSTLFISLEMAEVELAQRMLCSQGRVDASRLRTGRLSDMDRKSLIEASTGLSRAPLFIDDAPMKTVTQIAAAARRMKRQHGLGLLIIDYMQLIQPDDPRDPRQEQVAKMARRLKGLSRELEIPVLCLAQLNRQVEQNGKEGHRPRLSHLRESGAIEQDADVVAFVHREEYFCKDREAAVEAGVAGLGEIIVAKQRNGPTGTVKLVWLDKYTRFENLAHEKYEEFMEFEPEVQGVSVAEQQKLAKAKYLVGLSVGTMAMEGQSEGLDEEFIEKMTQKTFDEIS